jgi:hypothetical protein
MGRVRPIGVHGLREYAARGAFERNALSSRSAPEAGYAFDDATAGSVKAQWRHEAILADAVSRVRSSKPEPCDS